MIGHSAPYSTLPAFAGAWCAGPAGVSFNRFGFADPNTGLVSNAYSPGQEMGIVLPQPLRYGRNGWNLAQWSNFVPPGSPPLPPSGIPPTLILRQGMPCTLLIQGRFIMQFLGGTQVGQQVFASVADGSAWTGVTGAGYLPTAWTTLGACGPNGRVQINTYVPPF
jgi:hypothetical protein